MSVPSRPHGASAPQPSSFSSGVPRGHGRGPSIADRPTRKAVLRPGARTRFAHLLRTPVDGGLGLSSGSRALVSESGRAPGAAAPAGGALPFAGHSSSRPVAALHTTPPPEAQLRAVTAEAVASDGQEPLPAFQPAPGVLAPPTPAPPPSSAGPPPGAHAQAAALAGQLVRSMRVGRIGRDRHRVDMRLGNAVREGIEVSLEHERGRIRAVFRADVDAKPDAQRIAERLTTELGRRGVDIEEVEVEIA